MRAIQAGIPPCLAHLATPSTIPPPPPPDDEMMQIDAEPPSGAVAAAAGLMGAVRSDAHRLLYYLATRARSYDLGVRVQSCPLSRRPTSPPHDPPVAAKISLTLFTSRFRSTYLWRSPRAGPRWRPRNCSSCATWPSTPLGWNRCRHWQRCNRIASGGLGCFGFIFQM